MANTSSAKAAAAPAAATTAEGSLLDQIMAQTRLAPQDDGYAIARKGVGAFIAELLAGRDAAKVDKQAVDAMIAEIDRKVGSQLDEILHEDRFQALESAWRGLKLVIDRADFRENTVIKLLNVSKDGLRADFEDAPEVAQSGLYKLIYSGEYGQFGGEPYAALIANYDFAPTAPDIALLQKAASVATMAHAPFIAAAAPKFFGLDDFERLPNLNDLKSILEGPQYAKWRSFRESEDARSVGLTLPRFLLRLPYGQDTVPVKSFAYQEDVGGEHGNYLWGNAAFAFATRLTESFAKYRWCPNVIGPQSGGSVDDLPLHHFQSMGDLETKIPTEVLISERREFELAEEGFIALAMRKGSDNACFFSANSCQKPKTFGNSAEGRQAETNYRLGTQLPYLFIVNRLAHYIKVLQREQIGSWKESSDLERELNAWIGQYVADMDNPQASVRNSRPLRNAQITVEDVPGDAGWYRVGLKVRPHFKYMGASFTLSLVGKLDK
ncbi:MAG: type VI secretion system contractile sheath large subunit [Planctomycetes bacterium]|nr:type VI secretion system contractile sheath large subunit [Planctomycetota bacterium]